MESKNITRRNDIQGLRAIAVIAVIAFHAGLPIPGGFAGVDIFFVISGFVITLMLAQEWRLSGSLDLTRFYIRRFKRLMPALALLVGVTIAAAFLLSSPLALTVRNSAFTGIGAMAMAANLVIAKTTGGYFDPTADSNPLLHTWSLSVEEQFYLLFPITLVACYFLAKRWRYAPSVIVAVGCLLSFLIAMRGAATHAPDTHLISGFYSPISRAWEFAAGALLALGGNKCSPRTKASSNLSATAGLVMVSIALFALSGKTAWPGPWTMLPVLGSMALIYAGTGTRPSDVSRILASKLLVYIGDVSYSLYLWHWPFIVFASAIYGPDPLTLCLAACLSAVPAIASYSVLETPLRKLPVGPWPKFTKLVAFTLVTPIAVCGLLVYSNSKNYWSDGVIAFKAAVDPIHVANEAGCGQGQIPSALGGECLWNPKASGMPVYLVGDSNADHVSESVIKAAALVGSPTIVFTKGGCSFLGRSWSDRSDIEQNKCLVFVDGTLDYLDRAPNGIVILGISDSIWRSPVSGVGPTRETESEDATRTVPYLQQELTEKVRTIRNRGHRVILLKPVPKFVSPDNKLLFDPAKCTTFSALQGNCPRKIVLTISQQDVLQHDARSAIENSAQATGSTSIDLRSIFCPADECTNVGADGIMFRDAGHLTVKAGEKLTGVFVTAISGTTKKSPNP